MSSCLFCSIVAGDIPCNEIHRDEEILAFADIQPQAPTHILVIPCRHIGGLNELGEADADLVGRLLLQGRRIAREQGLADAGYRFVINSGQDGGQTVGHLHLHILGGRPMAWPPG